MAMRITVDPKPAEQLFTTGILHQTSLWGRVKSRLGWIPEAFDISVPGFPGGEPSDPTDLLIVRRDIGEGSSMAYAPFGPEYLPDEEARGLYLERLSEKLRPLLPADCLFVRYDLPWESPYADDPSRFDRTRGWLGAPEPRVRETRMNWGTEHHALCVSPSGGLPPDTILMDLAPSEEEILGGMKPVTRRNIRLADRRRVEVLEGDESDLPLWYELYRETARRNRFQLHGIEHFAAVLAERDKKSGARGKDERIRLLLARVGNRVVAGLILALSGRRATYLYGASTAEAHEARASYALQWTAIRKAKAAGAREYDLFGCSPRADPAHPLYGLWRFKIGFGGRLFHHQGSWDYPFKPAEYEVYRARESAAAGFHLRTAESG